MLDLRARGRDLAVIELSPFPFVDEGQSESLIAGKNFGIGTNIITGPDGNLYVTSLSNGAVYMISR